MKEEKKRLWKRLKKTLKMAGLAALIFHAPTQIAYIGNDLYHKNRSSGIRNEFKQKFGFPILGWEDEIEKNQKNITILSDVIEREKMEKDFYLKSLRIESSNYLKKNLLGQIASIVAEPASGQYFLGRIGLSHHANRDTLHHEIKHAKTFEIIRKNSEFLSKWKELAKDDRGESLYYNSGEWLCSYVKGLSSLVDKEKSNTERNRKLGFITDYARTWVYEDIAELCGEAEQNSDTFMNLVAGDSASKNEVITKKFNLAAEYGLVPMESIEYFGLRIAFRKTAVWHGYLDLSKTGSFMEGSSKFLKNHPQSVYTSDLRNIRAHIMLQGALSHDPKFKSEVAINELKAVLTSRYKDPSSYVCALSRLAKFYKSHLGDNINAGIYERAENLYWKRFENGDVEIASRGVNDFIVQEGIDLR